MTVVVTNDAVSWCSQWQCNMSLLQLTGG